MKIDFLKSADKEYRSLSPELQKRTKKQLSFLAANLHHPSLHAKKYDESRDIWQGRINDDYRFYFVTEGDTYYIIGITKHPK
jgi:mRNA-degrading endonuclease RelE of RelBE toxin-antitoxin system